MSRLLILLCLALLPLTACADGGPPPDSRETGSSESPTAEPEPEPVDPCRLLTADELAPAKIEGTIEAAQRVIGEESHLVLCQVQESSLSQTFFGYSMIKGLSARKGIDYYDDGARKPTRLDVGDEAYLKTGSNYAGEFTRAFASQGDYTAFLRLPMRADRALVTDLLTAMLGRAAPEMFDFPIQLPDECPPADNRRVTAVIGAVVTATGSAGDTEIVCDYTNAKGQELSLSRGRFATEKDRKAVIDYYDEHVRDTMPIDAGATLYVQIGDATAYGTAYSRGSMGTAGVGMQQLADRYRPLPSLSLDVDRKPFVVLASWWAEPAFAD